MYIIIFLNNPLTMSSSSDNILQAQTYALFDYSNAISFVHYFILLQEDRVQFVFLSNMYLNIVPYYPFYCNYTWEGRKHSNTGKGLMH